MSEGYCRFELIYPAWVAWVVLVVGAAIAILAFWRLFTRIASGTLTWDTITLSDIFPVLLLLIGLALGAGGVGGIAALNHQPFARWAVGVFPAILAEADEPAAGDFNDKPLGEIFPEGGSAYYVIRLSPAARNVKISGKYRDAPCDADLLMRICRNNGDKLTCNEDAAKRILRICPKGDDLSCTSQAL
jgi:hypothetical protein